MTTVATMVETKRAEVPAGTARAKVTAYGMVQLDGDLIRPGSLRNKFAMVSRGEHAAFLNAEPLVGYARLEEQEDGVYVEIEYFETDACELARATQWSVGYRVAESHRPTAEELAEFPGAKRIITGWTIFEVSPVSNPASPGTGSAEVCCGGECTVGGKSCCAECEVRAAGLAELARFEHTKFRLLESARKARERWRETESWASRRPNPADADAAVLVKHELPVSQVPAGTRWAAVEAVALAAKVLGGRPPGIRWYDPAAIADVAAVGLHFKGDAEIWLAAQADAEAVFQVAGHETFHALALKGGDEQAAEFFGTALALLRGGELHVGPRKSFEDRLERVKVECFVPYLAAPSPRLQLVPGLHAGSLVADDCVIFERTDDGWRRVAALVA